MTLDPADPLRQTGRTTRQIQNAPVGALFIWCTSDTYMARRIARESHRDDLVIASQFSLDRHAFGHRYPAVVVDHAARLSRLQLEQLDRIRERLLK